MESYKRFTDESYKNWLKTAESLYILRRHIRDFVENETETYHKSLRESLQREVCVKDCKKYSPQEKKSPLCDRCEQWKVKILENRHTKYGIHWENCQPYLWATEKWEVAKVYMPRTPKEHRSFDQFDISAILNFMSQCKHFKTFVKSDFLNKVINVRNNVMHSPDLRLSKKDMEDYIANVVQLAKFLEPHALGLKDISEEIQQFKENLEKYCGQSSPNAENSKDENVKLINREHQALKEKIEFLAQHYEEEQHADLKKELQGMKGFLEQNKDLLENLGPYVNQLDEIQEKVNKHDHQIDNLKNRVDKLEETQDPVFIGDPLKFKNHLIEEAKKCKWSDPVFTEVLEANGYRGQVEVNGHIFTGSYVCNSKKSAHQEVAKKALQNLKFCYYSTEQFSHPGCIDKPSTSSTTPSVNPVTSASNALFYASATVVLKNQEVVSDGCAQQEHAIESAYKKLACLFHLNAHGGAGNSFKTMVLAHFDSCHYPPPSEHLDQQDDKNFCKLLLCGPFTFHDKDGSIKKKQTEQQVAMVALQQLSGILNCSFDSVDGGNYKGFLKECLDAHGLKQPKYSTERKEVDIEDGECPNTSGDNSHSYCTRTPRVFSKDASLQPEDNAAVVQPLPTTHPDHNDVHLIGIQGTQTPPIPCQVAKLDCADALFYASATVVLKNQEVVSDGCAQQEHAIESAYKKLACLFRLNAHGGAGNSFKTMVLAQFDSCHYPPPSEHFDQQDDKNFCKLLLCGPFTFHDKDGSIKKKQAEQQVAMVALQQLSGILNCSFDSVDGNYKGFLKECLDAHGLKQPMYSTERKKVDIEEGEGSNTSGDNSYYTKGNQTDTKGNQTRPIPCKVAKLECEEIHTLLALFNLKPPSVTLESVSNEQKFGITVEVILDNLTFKNKDPCTSRRDAIRKAYYSLGCALGICQSNTDATMLVKQDFSQKSFPLPKEVIEGNIEPFYCSLNNISYNVIYEGQGSTETDAKHDGLQKALHALPLIFGYKTLPSSGNAEEMEAQINTILTRKNQKKLTYSLKWHRYMSSAKLLFKDYTMKSTRQANKKANRSHLSRCMLSLLGEKTESNGPSFRSCLDEWFMKRGLQPPVFEDTEEAQGSKAMFSVSLSCSHADWEDNLEAAIEKLIQELSKRFRYLTEQDTY
ncbi:uncharacterized protein si:ch211-91p5.3 isoform X1 [Electrophorus electricus]|uniref:uncharacterized protein si:ch211-91p5.3 isoform X1 n=1 Tax=Electrophorus electricus TaxID=8005 RepID=UPI0015CFCB45|nr:uncharacterized protein si:ch211-91p5.3 isoform X1 [Electrophorus electricus]